MANRTTVRTASTSASTSGAPTRSGAGALTSLPATVWCQVLVAHRLSTVRGADTICVVSHGRIAEQGAHDELIALDGAYKKLVLRQMTRSPAMGPKPDAEPHESAAE